MNIATIAIFPLKLVLFPDSIIPLHIFEERYIRMINDYFEKSLGFGINLSISSKNYNAGCAVNGVEIVKKYDDGRLDIIVKGGRRYYVNSLEKGEYGYLTGNPNFFEDITNNYDRFTLIDCINVYNDIVHLLKNDSISEININDLKTEKPSFFLAQKSGLTVLQRQYILELKSENERLMSILQHLQKIFPTLRETEMVNRIIKNDGYLTN
jgi:Lon protease-like protein